MKANWKHISRRVAKIAGGITIPAVLVVLVTASVGQPSLTAVEGTPSPDALRDIIQRIEEAGNDIRSHARPSTAVLNWLDPAMEEQSPIAIAVESMAEGLDLFDESGKAAEAMAERIAQVQLEGVAWNEQNPLAFLNGKVVPLDGEVNGLNVVFIGERQVVLTDEYGNTQALALTDYGDFKRPRE